MRSTFRILFYAKGKAVRSNGKIPLMVRITIDGEMVQFSTKAEIDPAIWSVKFGRAEGKTKEALQINNYLDNIRAQLVSHHNNIVQFGEIATPELLRNAFLGFDVKNHTLMKVFADFNERKEKLIGIDIAQSTFNKYDLTYRRLESFLKEHKKLSDIPFHKINLDFIMQFESYLRSDCRLSNNSAEKLIRIFKRIVSISKSNGLIKVDPFCDYRIRVKRIDRGYLTHEELSCVINRSFNSPRLDKVRDIFVFCCFTGLAYSDVFNLTTENLVSGFDSALWIMTHRQKTGTKSNIKLLEIPLAIVKKYENKRDGNKLLPVMSNAKFNLYLKEIMKACEITKNVTVHIARHTFATTVTLANGVPIESVSKMLGHTNVKTTQIYARILDSKVSADMDDLARKLAF